jgi:hypothetical protein
MMVVECYVLTICKLWAKRNLERSGGNKTKAEPIDSASFNPLFSFSNSNATLNARPLVAQIAVVTASTFLLLDRLLTVLRLLCFFIQDVTKPIP